ncbi:hypothetical protein Tco_0835960 [Tanacetum coccineum]
MDIFLGRVAFPAVEHYLLNSLKKYGITRVMGDKHGFIFIQLSSMAGLEGGRMDYAHALVDIRVDQALKDTMVISVPNLVGNGCPKRVMADLMKLRGTYNDGFQTVQMKVVCDPIVSKHGWEVIRVCLSSRCLNLLTRRRRLVLRCLLHFSAHTWVLARWARASAWPERQARIEF